MTTRTNSDYDRIGLEFANIGAVPTEDIHAALALVRRCLRPTPAAFIAKHLAACDLVTKSRPEHAADTQGRISIFVEDLSEFPADVVAEALRFWRRTETWSPAVSDIRSRCWRGAAVRISAKRELERELKRRTA